MDSQLSRTRRMLLSLPATASDPVTLGCQRATASMWPRTLPRVKVVQSPHDESHEQAVRILRRHGVRNTEDGKRRMLSLGYKYEGSDLQAALLLGQLARIDSTRQARLRIFC